MGESSGAAAGADSSGWGAAGGDDFQPAAGSLSGPDPAAVGPATEGGAGGFPARALPGEAEGAPVAGAFGAAAVGAGGGHEAQEGGFASPPQEGAGEQTGYWEGEAYAGGEQVDYGSPAQAEGWIAGGHPAGGSAAYVEGVTPGYMGTPLTAAEAAASGAAGGATGLGMAEMQSDGRARFPNLALVDEDDVLGWSLRFDDAEQALGALKHVSEELVESVASLTRLADKRAARGGGSADESEPWAEDGAALDAAPSIAARVEAALGASIQALAATDGESAASNPDVVRMRNVLFQIVSRVRGDVRRALEDAEISEEDLAAVEALEEQQEAAAAAAAASAASSPLPSGRSSARNSIAAGSRRRLGSGEASPTVGLSAMRRRASSIRELLANPLLTGASPDAGTPGTSGPTSPALGAESGDGDARASGSTPGAHGTPPTLSPGGGVWQPGLVKMFENPSGRRMKAVALGPEDLFGLVRARTFALGLFSRLGSGRLRAKMAAKLLFVGCLAKFGKQRYERRRAARLMALGVLGRAMRLRELRKRAKKSFLIGVFAAYSRWRAEAQRKARVMAIGSLALAVRERNQLRHRTLLFALGCGPTDLRTQGNPTGYVPEKKKKKKKLPASNGMSQIHWEPLEDIKGTIWEDTRRLRNDRQVLKELFPDLREVFTPVKKKPAAASAAAAKPKVTKISFIGDSKEKQAVGIAINSFKALGFEQLSRELTDMNLDNIPGGLEGVEKMLMALPSPASLAAAASQPVDKIPQMDMPEQYIMAMRHVPLMSERLGCMKLRASLSESMEETAEDIELFIDACNEILENSMLKELLVGIFLPFGELLHKGTRKQGTKGVKMAHIIKLAESKTAKDMKKTALYYIIQALADKRPHLLDIVNQFSASQAAAKSSMDKPMLRMKEIKTSVATLTSSVEKAKKANDEVFVREIGSTAEKSQEAFAGLEAKFNDLQERFKACVHYMGEDAGIKFETFFQNWVKFIAVFEDTIAKFRADVAKAEKERQKKEEAAAKEAAKKAKLAEKRAKQAGGSNASAASAAGRA
ncbi:hypothetical protein FNF31_07370 [Cafeteria roenbergensis]|uniref:FH2 domain-containing protein n=1 Tax=Cafeteria roenbergensis TaxID=33653 RepID=A0A5A8C962_CAFRO|nr:hypothetical protein FNF31_07370 [Cafeteria roenbergensis]